MAATPSLVRHISDTALWAAAFRARETQRPDALFRDPFAARLAGSRGFEIADALSAPHHGTCWVTRTYLFDQFISREIARGVDAIVNLGAGLDARPYRMSLPPSIHWFEVDAPGILDYKSKLLSAEKPSCHLERFGLDLRDREARRKLLASLSSRRKTLAISEGLLIYLDAEEVVTLADDLAGAQFYRWIVEVVSPQVLETMRQTAGPHLRQSGSSFRFGPSQGPAFFLRHGWSTVELRGLLKTAVQLGRTPIDPKLLHCIPDSPTSSLPWIGVCLLEPQPTAGF